MAGRRDTGEIVKRALAYPYPSPRGSFLLRGEEVTELVPRETAPGGGVSQTSVSLPAGHRPLLAYGANASPAALTRKLAGLPQAPLFAARARLEDFDVVYSAHVSPYGAVPATLLPSPGTSVEVHVLYLDEEQLPRLVATEPNYDLTRLSGIVLRAELGPDDELSAVDAFVSRHGQLKLDGAPVALAAIPAHNRRFAELGEPEVLELVRAATSPELSLEQFILDCAEAAGLAPLPPLTVSGD